MTARIRKTLHPLTGAPLVPLELITKCGEVRLIWPILGGAEDDDSGGEGDSDSGDDTDDGDDEDAEGSDQLGDAGKKALDRMKARLKAERQKRTQAERERDEARSKKDGDDKQTDAEQIRRDAEAVASQKANGRILRAEIKAAAGGKLADPTDAVRLLDLSQFELDSDGDVDEDEIAEAIDDLLKKKPYLAAKSSDQNDDDKKRKLRPDRGQGSRGSQGASSSVASGRQLYDELIGGKKNTT